MSYTVYIKVLTHLHLYVYGTQDFCICVQMNECMHLFCSHCVFFWLKCVCLWQINFFCHLSGCSAQVPFYFLLFITLCLLWWPDVWSLGYLIPSSFMPFTHLESFVLSLMGCSKQLVTKNHIIIISENQIQWKEQSQKKKMAIAAVGGDFSIWFFKMHWIEPDYLILWQNRLLDT